jgi:3-isopropylmalate/(R)-2-methylmalate dehydratase small subunit
MTPFTTVTSIVAHLPRDNVDTDAIIPSREMKSTGKSGLKDGLFAPWRYLDVDARTPDPGFVLNQPEFSGAQILASGVNFGCGSSREHAVWALAEFGIRCVIAESFAPIFRNNCVRNGVLPIALGRPVWPEIIGQIVTVDLASQSVKIGEFSRLFHIDEEAKMMLLEGLDVIDLTLKHRDSISAWQAKDRVARPWVYFSPPHPKDGEGDHEAQLHGGGVRSRLRKSNEAVNRARQLRREMSPAERRLWQALQARPEGLKFRKQHPADRFTLDFYCAAASLCIELDGQAHDYGNRPERDGKRDAFLERNGIATLRVAARDVKDNLEDVVKHIVETARARIPLHHSAMRNGPPPHFANGEEK